MTQKGGSRVATMQRNGPYAIFAACEPGKGNETKASQTEVVQNRIHSACERIQVSLKRNHAFQIWREDMLAQREQGEKITRSLERISIFKAFRTWKLDMLFLKSMEHGVITVRDIITKHKWNKFFQLWKEWNEFFKKKAATVKPRKSTASTADEIARERRRRCGRGF